jgi:hypothetical protein
MNISVFSKKSENVILAQKKAIYTEGSYFLSKKMSDSSNSFFLTIF